MVQKKEGKKFAVALSLPIEIRPVYEKLREQGRLSPSALAINAMCREFPEIAAALGGQKDAEKEV
jgi:hypothetical protein